MNIFQMFSCHKKRKLAGRESLQRLPQGDSKRLEKAPNIWLPFAIRNPFDVALKQLSKFVKRP